MTYNNLFAIPVSRKKQTSMRRKFIVFSSVLFLLIFVIGSVAFFILMRQMLHDNAGNELMQIVEIEKFKLEAYVNGEIAIVRKMATSPLIQQYFLNPDDEETAKIALEDIEGYRRTFLSNSLFWINDADKKFYINGEYAYTIDPRDSGNYWYNMTLYETQTYNFNINYNPELDMTNLWINAPVFDKGQKAIGMLGTGMDLPGFINALSMNYYGQTELYFFNAAGEITGTQDIELVEKKVFLEDKLGQTGAEILAKVKNLKEGEINYFKINDWRGGVAAFCKIPALDWNIAAIHHLTIMDTLQTGMTLLFAVMMVVIFSIFVVLNLFTSVLLEPLNRLVKKLSKISREWELQPQNEMKHKDEVETLGEFLNMTIIDQLTGIYNKRFLNGNLKKIIKSLSRSNGKLSLLMADIDCFKKYNDTYGHDMGDKCLQKVASTLTQCVTREEDFVARYGGEEFAIVLPNTDEEGAGIIAEKILRKINECNIPHKNSDVADFVTVSVGGTTCTVKYTQNESDFIKRADEALYKSKQDGRNRYTFKSLE
jgi:diguanylate cyclase (GGDEF)-like protein